MKQFHLDNFVEVVSNSRFINSLPVEESGKIKWFLFNAAEESQKEFFEMFLKENELSSKMFNEAFKVTKSYLEQYNEDNKALHSKLLKRIGKFNEVHAQKKDKSSGESLLNSL